MRTERKRLIIFILFLAALAAALFLLFAPSAQFAAAEEQGETTETGGEGSGESSGESSGETGDEPAPPSAQNVASVTSGGGTVQYPDFSSALAAWTEESTLTLLTDVSTETAEISVSCTLDLNGYTLEGRSGRTLRVTAGTLTLTDSSSRGGGELAGGGVRVEGGGAFILEGGYITDNTAEDGAGVFVSVGGGFTMTGGTIMGNTATGTGGGVCLLGGSSFTMTGGRIVDNKASEIGGGVFAAGSVSLSGGASISGNTAGGKTGNLYLASEKRISVNSLSGRVGVSSAEGGVFATGIASGFFSDSSAYDVSPPNSSSEVTFSLVLSPLSRVTASFVSSENVFPTTALDALKSGVQLSGINKNGTEYPVSKIAFELSLPEGVERLTVGSNEIVLTATGDGGERAETSFSVEVVAPSLTSIETEFAQTMTVYFDSPVDTIAPGLTVTGQFNDGISRPIGRTPEETQALSGEDYITAVYSIEGSFASHENGAVTVSVQAGGALSSVEVHISKHTVDTADILVEDAVEVEREGAWGVSPEAFTPSLPAGVLSEVSLSGGGTVGNLPAGTYTVEIAFYVTDENNYELVGGPRTATLTVYYASLTVTSEDGSVTYTVEREGGIPLSWELLIEDVTDSVAAPKLDGGMEARQIFSVSLRDGGRIITELDTPITVRIRIDGFFSNKNVTLYRLAEDGGHIAVETTREGDYLIFSITSVQTQYAVAYDAGFGVYLALTIVFGVLCVGGAVLLVWYFKHKKKLDMTLPKQEE
ncbi:MAG TPA: hypothetical protein H9797_05645 [Candidatus Gallimonas gallistercoris]|uniref:Uncharacterized protein n=1 Tax=Candidatus Gallimonas gallistercoris TaxID=2838602 RepID=A0A9D2H1E1_9FIRM|nr:hypothetical protein [Candidatus Gallimonas gallistercoris]